ncbi:hypothetical protein BJ165DRAFT_1521675 [Panaeolus papilionaceus]|nr:hypothetical protein BJ165DRAFT_1521675 [Panaeolus papilionaceus]
MSTRTTKIIELESIEEYRMAVGSSGIKAFLFVDSNTPVPKRCSNCEESYKMLQGACGAPAYTSVSFYVIDMSEREDIGQDANIYLCPMIRFFKSDVLVETIEGHNNNKFWRSLKHYVQSS